MLQPEVNRSPQVSTNTSSKSPASSVLPDAQTEDRSTSPNKKELDRHVGLWDKQVTGLEKQIGELEESKKERGVFSYLVGANAVDDKALEGAKKQLELVKSLRDGIKQVGDRDLSEKELEGVIGYSKNKFKEFTKSRQELTENTTKELEAVIENADTGVAVAEGVRDAAVLGAATVASGGAVAAVAGYGVVASAGAAVAAGAATGAGVGGLTNAAKEAESVRLGLKTSEQAVADFQTGTIEDTKNGAIAGVSTVVGLGVAGKVAGKIGSTAETLAGKAVVGSSAGASGAVTGSGIGITGSVVQANQQFEAEYQGSPENKQVAYEKFMEERGLDGKGIVKSLAQSALSGGLGGAIGAGGGQLREGARSSLARGGIIAGQAVGTGASGLAVAALDGEITRDEVIQEVSSAFFGDVLGEMAGSQVGRNSNQTNSGGGALPIRPNEMRLSPELQNLRRGQQQENVPKSPELPNLQRGQQQQNVPRVDLELPEMSPGRVEVLGRSGNDGFRVADSAISREHAQIERSANGNYLLTDNSSFNGTYVQGRDGQWQQVNGQVEVKPGEVVRLADDYYVKIPDDSPSSKMERSRSGDLLKLEDVRHEGANAAESIELIKSLGLEPRHTIHSNGTTYQMSDVFYASSRKAVLAIVDDGSKQTLRVFYESKSQGGFRALPSIVDRAIGGIWYDKGLDEASLTLPYKIQKFISTELPLNRNVSRSDGYEVFEKSVRHFDNLPSRLAAQFDSELKNEFKEQPLLKKYDGPMEEAPDGEKRPPSRVVIEDVQKRPNYDKIVDSFLTRSSNEKNIQALVYHSNDGSVEYTMYMTTDGPTKVWFQSAVPAPGFFQNNSYGTYRDFIKASDLTTPLWEYRMYIPYDFQHGMGDGGHGLYGNAWEYVKKIPEIERWYAENDIDMPS